MQTLERIVRAVAVAAIINNVLACSEVKIFLAKPEMKQQGVRITREAALDVPSNLVKLDALKNIADEAKEHFDFDLNAFDGACQVPSMAACALKKCGCPGTSLGRRLTFAGNVFSFPVGNTPPAPVLSFPTGNTPQSSFGAPVFSFPTGNTPQSSFGAPVFSFPTGNASPGNSGNPPSQRKSGMICLPGGCSIGKRRLLSSDSTTTLTKSADETILAVCFGNKCKGFSLFSEVLVEERKKSCGDTQRDYAPGK